ncbi:GspE/PulE family protein [Patescibacteria group bacterium]|nr:GspE/PulE family protein [Patescibacteria group bacterium]MBU1890968.1 GspE/PulE family protein [Patescibacteria group bacterium]
MIQGTSSIEDLIKQSKSAANNSGKAQPTDKLQDKIQEIDIKEQERKTRVKAMELGLDYISLYSYPISPDILKVISEEDSRASQAVAFYESKGKLRVGIVNPENTELPRIIEMLSKKQHGGIELYLISPISFTKALEHYKRVVKIKEVVSGVQIGNEEIEQYRREITDFTILDERLKSENVTSVFSMILASAINIGTSDVHIEAEEKSIKVRFRIDGVLQDVASMSKDRWPKIVSRIKLMAKLKMNITTVPQDGRITIVLDDDKIEIRVSTLPTSYGESIVMRLLRSSATGLSFDDLGIRGLAYEHLKHEIKRPNGMIITTGPTGSGKTTTLYAILNLLNSPETKIITLEDPVEYKLEGISQSQIDSSRDYTFGKGLRAILRQDPDIVMVGEMRDSETVETAINAALTGHLVLSTIHTNSAAGTIPRFIAMDAKPFLLAPALNAVMAQRLVRRICENCKTEYKPSDVDMKRVNEIIGVIPEKSEQKIDTSNMKFYKGTGCAKCNNVGLRGRLGLYEVMAMTPAIEKIILSGNISEYTLQEAAVNDGMVTMVQDGILKALDGITSLDEVFRVAE